MKIFAKLRGEWIAIPCQNDWKISNLKQAIIEKSARLLHTPEVKGENFMIRKASNMALLDPEDSVATVLNDEDYVSVVDRTVNGTMVPDEIPRVTQKKNGIMYLDGSSLAPEDLMKLSAGQHSIRLTGPAWSAVEDARIMVDNIVADNRVVYGITTGFGKFANIVIEKDKISELQENLVRSHAAGVGKSLSLPRIRMLLALRINVLAKGYSGISRENLEKYIAAFNADCLPHVPSKGSVGASGDLAPLAHCALGLMGEGRMWSPITGWTEARLALEVNKLTPIRLTSKEGIALLNGTQLITALGAEAVERADYLCKQADVIAALTLEVLKGTTRAFDSKIHSIRPHPGQSLVAHRLRSLLHSSLYKSEIAMSHRFCHKVQDAYSLRCCPQVHGVVNDTVKFVRGLITCEMNSATDNPLVFADQKEIISAGNFHGEYPAKALDYLAIGIHELASISERRIERLVNPAYSELPAFLTNDGGLNSGFMMAHVTSAALVSENKTLCHPSSVDTLPTSGGQEDHVSMGPWAARKCLKVLENVENVLAIELLCACQGIEFLRPLKSTEPLEAVYRLVRSKVDSWDKDRYMSPDIEQARSLITQEKIWEVVRPYMTEYDSQQLIEMRVDSPTSANRKRRVSNPTALTEFHSVRRNGKLPRK